MSKGVAAAVRSISNGDDAMCQPEVHRWFDNVERSVEQLRDNMKRMNERLYHVLESTPADDGEKCLRPSHSTPMVERLSLISESVDALNAMTLDIINRIQI
ncbi:hypothetical protein J2801_003615 [Paraburkholderia phenoliruptrix]|uniref:hypothetical protein n=1 Tax=Paraburkholderia phenoliruptrix TaxID=252970 RepID=UPI00285D86DB|nr:hypothetical protein [Paraburkholderia phenoliruptrix]MDR6421327.1 hypothetical protein [Paraburkholderia phenoliruptrix]